MRGSPAVLCAAALAGCDAAPPAAAPQRPADPPPAAATAPPSRQFGTVSGLSGTASALSGRVSDFTVERTDTGRRVLLAADTLFDFDSATLAPAAERNLERTAELIEAGGKGRVTVTGHTDAKGDAAYNLTLSRRRADAVVTWLRQRPELQAPELVAIGRGEGDPIAPNTTAAGQDDPAGRARNRRVTVDIPD